MNSPLDVETSRIYNPRSAGSPLRVCMHVLNDARNDMRVMREATTLHEAGFSLTIVDVESNRDLPDEENIQNITLKHIIRPRWFVSARFKPWFLVKFLLMILSGTLQMLRVPADIYHAHDQKALPACFLAAWLRHKPLIFDAHELPLAEKSIKRWRRLYALATRALVGMLSRCAGVITVSSPIGEELRRHYHAREVALVRNVPPYQLIPRSERLQQHLGVTADVRIALYTGYFQENRGLDRLVRAAAFVGQNVRIVLMGSGYPEIHAQLEALIISEDVADRVHILPPVPYAQLLEWTASADLGLIVYTPEYSPNVRMCLPNKLFEYMMAGVPVLASELDAVAEVLRTRDVGQVVSSLTPADVGAAITSILANDAALARMRRNELEIARREFCWEEEKHYLLQLYHTILAKQHTKGEKGV